MIKRGIHKNRPGKIDSFFDAIIKDNMAAIKRSKTLLNALEADGYQPRYRDSFRNFCTPQIVL